MEIKAQLKAVQPVVERGDFKSKKVWVTTSDNPEYPQTIELEVSGKSLDIFDNIATGATVTCHINLRGREWTNPEGVVKVFNTIQCWRVEAAGVHQPAPTQSSPVGANIPLPDVTEQLPF